MTDRDKITHLLRRFGLGAGHYALSNYEKLGVAGTIESLLNDDQKPEGFDVDPWEFCSQDDKKIETNSYVLGGWWALRLLMTRRPLQEKLTIFWHDHFAINVEKVYEAPTVMDYLDTIRTKGRGKFRDLFKEMIPHPAMLTYLDGNTSSRVHPNENLARETLELFSMGEGNYTEKDIQELARALTGWTTHYLGLYMEEPYEVTRQKAIKARISINNFALVPALHDAGMKTILGKTGRFTGDEALDMIASHPQTANYICGKLWLFFAGTTATPTVLKRLTDTWKKTDGEIRSVLRAIMTAPEFFSSDVVMGLPKSPVDWVIGLYRSLDLFEALTALRGKKGPDTQPIRKELREAGNGAHYLMAIQGQSLLYPPDVAGWNWGRAWISTDNLVRRLSNADVLFWGGGDSRPLTVHLASRMVRDFKVTDSAGIVKAFGEVFDLPFPPDAMSVLVGLVDKHGSVGAFRDKNQAANLFARLGKAAFAAPTSQLC